MRLTAILSKLGFEATEGELYEYLLQHGSSPVGVLAKRLGIPRTTLYTMLSRLRDRGLIRETTKKGLKIYGAESPDAVSHHLSLRISEMETSQQDFAKILPVLRERYRSTATVPRLTVLEGQDALPNVLNDMLLYADLETCAVWPIRKMIAALSPEFFRFHNKERIRRNLYTRAIWPQAEAVAVADYPFLGWGKEFKREIRIAPPDISYSLGYWMYSNKVAFLSSIAEGYGFIIQSDELVATLKAQFELLWNLSKPLQFARKDVERFLAELG